MNNQTDQSAATGPFLWWLALIVATLGGLIAPVARVSGIFSDSELRFVSWPMTALVTILFVRMLFDRDCRRAIDAANAERQGNGPNRWRGLFRDPIWGLFGSRCGIGYLPKARAALMVEFVVMLIFSGRNGLNLQPPLILTAAFAIVTPLMLAQLKNHYPSVTAVNPS